MNLLIDTLKPYLHHKSMKAYVAGNNFFITKEAIRQSFAVPIHPLSRPFSHSRILSL